MTIRPWRSPGTTGAHPAATGRMMPGLAVPPARMPARQGTRPLKRWRYAGLYGPDLMLCAGIARVGPVPQAFWAVWDRRRGVLDTETQLLRTSHVRVEPGEVRFEAGGMRVQLALSPAGQPVEVMSPHGRSYIWTRKTPVRGDGHITSGMEARPISAFGILDESAGYHARDTAWEWSAGVGTSIDGHPLAWNLVRGVHDSDTLSERTVWVAGRPVEAPPVRFAADLDELWGSDGSLLRFQEEAVRARSDRLWVMSSEYVQPFGRFRGTLPGGIELADTEPALGVMERHRARW